MSTRNYERNEMSIFKQIMLEAEANEKSCFIFPGRFQPFMNGHSAAIKKAIKECKGMTPVVVIVKGKETSKDGDKNPLDAEYQETMIKKVFPSIKVVIVTKGYIPAIISEVKDKLGLEIKGVVAGEDRIDGYRNQVIFANKKNAKSDEHPQINITKWVESERSASATEVRDAVRSGDQSRFNKLMPQQLQSEWVKLREMIVPVNESVFLEGDKVLFEDELLQESRYNTAVVDIIDDYVTRLNTKDPPDGLFLRCKNLKELPDDMPEVIEGMLDLADNELNSFKNFPKKVVRCYVGAGGGRPEDGAIYCAQNYFASLKGIEKHIQEVEGFDGIDFTENPIKSHVLGLLKIKGLKKVWFARFGVGTQYIKDLEKIVNKYLPEGDILDCQEELIVAGYDAYAQL
jgi:nicotinamide mononucleotide adenylyltransferase